MALEEKESGEKVDSTVLSSPAVAADGKKKRKGFFSRIWNMLFRVRGDDFEKRLQYISKEEAIVRSRMKRRSITFRKLIRNLIIFSVFFEIIAVVYAIMTTRETDLDLKVRSFRILPMFVLPAVSFLVYSSVVSFSKMCERRDQHSLEKLQAEKLAKINELKEKTNYYNTQQLIQRYDPDPAAKAAAATVLASKLGADSGLKVFLGDESQLHPPTDKNKDKDVTHPQGLRNRKQPNTQRSSGSNTLAHRSDNESHHSGTSEGIEGTEHKQQTVFEHYNPQGHAAHDGSWISRIAALLVGEDPTQSFALICGNCRMHNGLARKEDFSYITYYCPHCHALNKPKLSEDHSLIAPPAHTKLAATGSLNSSSSTSERGSSPVPALNTPEIVEEEEEEVPVTSESRTPS